MTLATANAALTVPESFYQYTALRPEERRQWVQSLICDGKSYFRSRAQLNDPNELRPKIVFQGSEAQLRAFAKDQIRNRAPRMPPAARLRLLSQVLHQWKNGNGIDAPLHEVMDRVGLFCVSEDAAASLMWAHYADGHRGVAIELDPSVGFLNEAQPIVYSAESPLINRVLDDPDEMVVKAMFTKSLHWAYEKEWRVIARWNDDVRNARYIEQHNVSSEAESFVRSWHGAGDYHLPANAIKSVILGDQARGEAAWIRGLLDQAGHAATVKQATLHRDGTVTIA